MQWVTTRTEVDATATVYFPLAFGVMQHLRNFSIIAHIDHGKSTLADRMIEITRTIDGRRMQAQVLDSMELERERGITIKMAPVRMRWRRGGAPTEPEHVLHLIDTPGHIDFSYEVSRALKAVEGVVLLVDATQGVQAQTLTVLAMARAQGLAIIPALSKVDMPTARVDEIKLELAALLDCDVDAIIETSGKTGAGVRELLDAIIVRVPPPSADAHPDTFRGLIFDFQYSNHRGVIVYTRVFGGEVRKGQKLRFAASRAPFTALEVGTFHPAREPCEQLAGGEIGYIVTGIKKPGIAAVGDTVMDAHASVPPLPGYQKPVPVVWSSLYPESQDDFASLRQALDRLRLSDSSLSYEEESSGVLGRGFRCGFLGMLHMEIVTERLRREFSLSLIVTAPTIAYEVTLMDGTQKSIYAPHCFPDAHHIRAVRERWVEGTIIAPAAYTSALAPLLHEFEGIATHTETLADGRVSLSFSMPLRELMRNFFDRLKSATSGYASVSYELAEMCPAEVVRLDVLVAGELVPAFSRVVARHRAQEEAKAVVEKLHGLLPRQQFAVKIQAAVGGRILASRTLSAFRKDVTAKLYGGDVTRKMKLLEKQKKGKQKMRQRGKVDIPHEVFMKMVRTDSA